MPQKDHVQRKITALQTQWNLFSEKLARVEKEYILETRESEKFRLEHEIADIRADCQRIEARLNRLEQDGVDPDAAAQTLSNLGERVTNFIFDKDEQREQRNRQIMLARVRQFWVEGVLEKSLPNEMLIQLGKQEQSAAVQHPWEIQVQETAAHESLPLPEDKPIIAIFEEMGRSLLILGAPGSGKTITLLELTRAAILRAENDPMQPIPVVLNLSSWAERKQPLAEWIAAELNLKYQIPKNVGQQWIEQNEVLLLLDGLDEAASEQREACADALNQFRQAHGLIGMVVCSRAEEYYALATRLALAGALVIQPLTRTQIEDYLAARPEFAALHTVLQEDAALQELAESPLMLNIMMLAYQGLSVEEVRSADAVAERRKRLFATYTERMLKRRGADTRYPPQQTRRWLAWLAGQMSRRSQTEFFIEGLQPTWLSTPAQRVWYAVGVRVIVGFGIMLTIFLATALFHGLAAVEAWLAGGTTNVFTAILTKPFGVPIPRTGGLVLAMLAVGLLLAAAFELASIFALKLPPWLSVACTVSIIAAAIIGGVRTGTRLNWGGGIGVGLLCGLPGGWMGVSAADRSYIKIAEKLTWSWRKALLTLAGSVTLAAALKLLLKLAWGDILKNGPFLALTLILAFGLTRRTVTELRTIPNQGILRSARNAVRVAGLVLAASVSLCVAVTVLFLKASLLLGLSMGLFVGMLTGLGFGLSVGGAACIQHAILRYLLRQNGDLPRDLIRFCDYAVERIFLRKVGGGYIFTHRMLLEYFATLEEIK